MKLSEKKRKTVVHKLEYKVEQWETRFKSLKRIVEVSVYNHLVKTFKFL